LPPHYDLTRGHVAAGVRRGDQLLFYLDGEIQAQDTIGDNAVNTLSFSFSLSDPSAAATIDDVQLFDSALSAPDLAAIPPFPKAGLFNSLDNPKIFFSEGNTESI
jgi:hypothetical protein